MVKKTLKITLFISIGLGLSACSLVKTHSDRYHFGETGEVPLNLKGEKSAQEFQDVQRELDLHKASQLSEFQIASIQNRVDLRKHERNLRTSTERQQYFQYKPFFRNDRQRIHFLSLPDVAAREAYSNSKGFSNSVDFITPLDQEAAESNDLYIGMSKSGVRHSWGSPDQVEVAGSPLYGNERWLYSDYVPSPDGFVKEKKVIYFEGSRVVGWEKK